MSSKEFKSDYLQFLDLFERYRGKELRDKLESSDGFGVSDLFEIFRRSSDSGIWEGELYRELHDLGYNGESSWYSFRRPIFAAPPEEAIEFFRMYMRSNKFERHWDLVLSTSSPSLFVDTPNLHGDGVFKAEAAYRLVHPELFSSGHEFQFSDRNIDVVLMKSDLSDHIEYHGVFDLITFWLPWNTPIEVDRVETIAACAGGLSENGVLISWLPTSQIAEGLEEWRKAQLSISAVYVLPAAGSYGFKAESSLVIFQKKEWQSHTYIARIPQSEFLTLESFSHWNEDDCAKSNGEWIELRDLNVSFKDITGWRVLKKRLRREGMAMIEWAECFREADVDDDPKLTISLGSEVWAAKNPLIFAYIRFWIRNTEDGKLWLGSVWKKPISDRSIPIPTEGRMEQVMSDLRSLETLKSKLNSIGEEIFQANAENSALLKAMSELGTLKNLPERLPWPLSSILRAYFIEKEVRRKADRLNYFFEAAAVFLPTILFSLVWSNDDLKSKWSEFYSQKRGEGSGSKFTRPTMGSWNTLFSTLQRFLRKENNRLGGDFNGLSAKLGEVNSSFLRALLDKKLAEVLFDALTGRNDRAHWGALGDLEYNELHDRMLDQLKRFDSIVGFIFEEVPLVSAVKGSMEFLPNGRFELSVRKLMGTSESFDRFDIEVLQPMLVGEVYLHSANTFNAVKLVPIIAVDENNICRFFNRIEGEEIRYVSYQSELESNSVLTPLTDELTVIIEMLG